MGYLARRQLKVGDRFLSPGMPVPEVDVTPNLIQHGHVELVEGKRWQEACAEYGEPPAGPLPKDGRWLYKDEDPDDVVWASGTVAEKPAADLKALAALNVKALKAKLKELGKDPNELQGSGKGGRVTKSDLIEAIAEGSS